MLREKKSIKEYQLNITNDVLYDNTNLSISNIEDKIYIDIPHPITNYQECIFECGNTSGGKIVDKQRSIYSTNTFKFTNNDFTDYHSKFINGKDNDDIDNKLGDLYIYSYPCDLYPAPKEWLLTTGMYVGAFILNAFWITPTRLCIFRMGIQTNCVLYRIIGRSYGLGEKKVHDFQLISINIPSIRKRRLFMLRNNAYKPAHLINTEYNLGHFQIGSLYNTNTLRFKILKSILYNEGNVTTNIRFLTSNNHFNYYPISYIYGGISGKYEFQISWDSWEQLDGSTSFSTTIFNTINRGGIEFYSKTHMDNDYLYMDIIFSGTDEYSVGGHVILDTDRVFHINYTKFDNLDIQMEVINTEIDNAYYLVKNFSLKTDMLNNTIEEYLVLVNKKISDISYNISGLLSAYTTPKSIKIPKRISCIQIISDYLFNYLETSDVPVNNTVYSGELPNTNIRFKYMIWSNTYDKIELVANDADLIYDGEDSIFRYYHFNIIQGQINDNIFHLHGWMSTENIWTEKKFLIL